MAGLALALPVVLWQLWAFSRRPSSRMPSDLVVFVFFATFLLVVGVAFGYFLVLPRAMHFLTNFDQASSTSSSDPRDYYCSFVLLCLLAVGLVFEMPIFILALVRLGVLSDEKLRSNRRLGYFIVARRGAPAGGRPGDDHLRGRPADDPVRRVDLARGIDGTQGAPGRTGWVADP